MSDKSINFNDMSAEEIQELRDKTLKAWQTVKNTVNKIISNVIERVKNVCYGIVAVHMGLDVEDVKEILSFSQVLNLLSKYLDGGDVANE